MNSFSSFLLSVLLSTLFVSALPGSEPLKIADLEDWERYSLLRFLNKGSVADFEAIRGIGSSRAKAIRGSRPFFEAGDLFLLKGFGEETVSHLLQHLREENRKRANSARIAESLPRDQGSENSE